MGSGRPAKVTRRTPLKKHAIAARKPYPWAWRAKVSWSMPCWAEVPGSAAAAAFGGFVGGFALSNDGRNPVLGPGGLLEFALRAMESLIPPTARSEEHTSELQSLTNLVCRLLLEKKKINCNS